MKKVQILTLQLLAISFFTVALHAEEYPEATATSDPNVVTSPYPPNKKIDVTGFLPGDLARDPHTNKVFVVPTRMITPLVFKPEIIEDDPEDLPVRRPEVVADPGTDSGEVARPRAVAESELPPIGQETVETPVFVEPIIPVRSPRKIDAPLTDFIKYFVRSGQKNDSSTRAACLAPNLTKYYALSDATKAEAIQTQESIIAKWPRRIYVDSGKARFVRWISEKTDEEFVVVIRVYQSLKSETEETRRGYADHRLSIRQKPDGTFEITAAEERHPHSILAGQ